MCRVIAIYIILYYANQSHKWGIKQLFENVQFHYQLFENVQFHYQLITIYKITLVSIHKNIHYA